jgi:hypothetical protein
VAVHLIFMVFSCVTNRKSLLYSPCGQHGRQAQDDFC